MAVVYKISNLVDDRVYIGSAVDFKRRKREHVNDLKSNRHANIHLQRFCNKYGLNLLQFEVIEECRDDVVLEREQLLLDSTKNLFNISTDASAPMAGRNHTKEVREHFSKIRTGEGNPMYGKKRKPHVVKAMQEARWNNVTKKEKVLKKINRQLRQEIIIEKDECSIRCMSQAHAADIIGVKHQSIQKSIKTGRCLCKGWSLEVCSNKIYTDELVKNHLYLFDDSTFFPQPELVEMLKNL
jgi:group I intron endonuclease